MSRRPRALFLDLDGTLANSLPVMRTVYATFLSRHGCVGDSREFSALNGPTLPEIVRTLRERHQLASTERQLEAEYRQLIAERYPVQARPSDGAHELLEAAARVGTRCVVVTSAEGIVARRFLEKHGLVDHVAGVITAEGLAHGKPHPAIYLRALHENHLAAENVWAVEDSPNGLRAAIAARIRTYAVVPANAPDPNVAGVSARIASLHELVPLIK